MTSSIHSCTLISIEGNIGTGKSTLLAHLQARFPEKIVFLKEPLHIWDSIRDEQGIPILVKYYESPSKYAFAFQMMAFISRIHLLRKAIRENPNSIIVSERSLYADREIFAKMLKKTNHIPEIEYQIYTMLFDEFIHDYPVHKFIYLQSSPEVCHQRVNKRAREGEDKIEFSYLKECHMYHDDWLIHMQSKDVLVLNGNKDIEETPEIMDQWIDAIQQYCQF